MCALFASNLRCLLTALVLSAALSCLAGCGSSSKIVGKVTYKGKPVPGGIVAFYGANNWTGTSDLDENGNYTIVKAPVGTVKITVDTSSYRPTQLPFAAPKMPNMQDMSKMAKPPEMPEEAKKNPLYNPQLRAERAKRYVEIPAKYAHPDTTDLTYEVKRGVQTHDIELK